MDIEKFSNKPVNMKKVVNYAEMLKGIRYAEWLELQEYVNGMFKEKMKRFEAELNLNLDDELKSDDD